MKERETLKLALEVLHYCEALNRSVEQQKMQAITAIKESLAQPEQKPMAFCKVEDVYDNDSVLTQLGVKRGDLLYTTPPQRKPLTDEQERKAFEKWCFSVGLMAESYGIISESSHCGTAWKAWQARATHGIKE